MYVLDTDILSLLQAGHAGSASGVDVSMLPTSRSRLSPESKCSGPASTIC